jgi:hypothetical protein
MKQIALYNTITALWFCFYAEAKEGSLFILSIVKLKEAVNTRLCRWLASLRETNHLSEVFLSGVSSITKSEPLKGNHRFSV